MGGFAADIKHLHNSITQRVAITTDGILFLARHGYFCRVKKDEIQDKSKADLLAKGLVCVQVLWVAGQAIERKVAGYPITLLEVHTLVHVVCAVVMYGLWIRKPMNVQDPTTWDLKDASDILAFMVEVSKDYHGKWSIRNLPGSARIKSGDEDPLEEPRFWWHTGSDRMHDQLENDAFGHRPAIFESDDDNQALVRRLERHICIYQEAHSLGHPDPGIANERKRYIPASHAKHVAAIYLAQMTDIYERGTGYRDYRNYLCGSPVEVKLSDKDVFRLDFSVKFLTGIKEFQRKRNAIPNSQDFSLQGVYRAFSGFDGSGLLLSLRSPNFTGAIINNMFDESMYLIAAMSMIPAAYGCIHFGALALTFPSLAEKVIWKISCYYLITTAIVYGILSLYTYLCNKFPSLYSKVYLVVAMMKRFFYLFGNGNKIWSLIHTGFVILILSLYLGARIYLVVESFISLRHVPIGVYQTPNVNFMNYIPHL